MESPYNRAQLLWQMIAAAQCVDGLRAHQIMGVGNQANAHQRPPACEIISAI